MDNRSPGNDTHLLKLPQADRKQDDTSGAARRQIVFIRPTSNPNPGMHCVLDDVGAPANSRETPLALPGLCARPSPGMMQIVAVVDASDDSVIVWHVDLGAATSGMSRMCGAWVLINEPIKLELLTRDRRVVATAAGVGAMAAAGNHTAMVDLVGTLDNVVKERDRLQHRYEDLPASRKKNLVAPRWPYLPIAPDPDYSLRAETTNPKVAVALGVARFLEQLAVAWTAIEGQRTARTYLDGPPTVRELPLARQ